MKQEVPEMYKNRARLLKLSLENNLSAAALNQMVAPMEGKSEEEKERMAEEMIEAILRNYQKDGTEAGLALKA